MKKILPIFVLILMFGTVSAQDYDYPDAVSVPYSEEESITVESSQTDGALSVEACGYTLGTADTTGGSGQGGAAIVDYPADITLRASEAAKCGIGQYEASIKRTSLGGTNTEEVGTFDINVDPYGGMDPNRGAYLYVELDVNPNKIRDFILTNDREPFYNSPGNEIHGVNDIQQGDVLIQETDRKSYPDGDDDYGRYRPPDGAVLGHEDVALIGIQSKSSVFTNNHVLGDDLGAQDVWTYNFGDINNVIGKNKGVCTAFENNFESCTPAHDNSGDYSADTEILKANKRFYICRGSMDGEIVDTSNYGELRCDVKGNGVDWRGNEPQSWISYNDCTDPVVGIRESNDEKAVFMNSNSGGQYTDSRTGCNYEDIDTTIETGEPDLFICDGDSAEETAATGNDAVTAEKDTYCQYQVESRQTPVPFQPVNQYECEEGTGSCRLGGYHNSTALAVKYYVSKEAVPVGSHAQGFEGSDFATSNGFNNVRFDHTHRAELDLLDGTAGETYEHPYTHFTSKYDELNISRGNAYTREVNDTNEDAIRQMWNPSNATGQYSDDIRETSEGINKISVGVNTSDVFNGGFYPNCETGLEWRGTGTGDSASGWECTGALDTDVQFYAFETGQFYGETTTGFFVMPYLFRQSEVGLDLTGDDQGRVPYYLATQNADNRAPATLESLSAVCWVGEKSDKPSQFDSSTSSHWFGKEVTGIGTNPGVPIPVFGNLTRDGGDSLDKYSCRFQFTNSEGQRVVAEGREVMVSREAMAQQMKAQSILQNTYQSYISPSWFEDQAVCNGNCQVLMDKTDLEDEVPQSHIDELRNAWESNLSYSFDTLGPSEDLGCYLKSGDRNC